jgi:hypothetical protein
MGAEFLDREQPGWASHINLEELDLSSCTRCVLGQLFGDFTDATYEMDLDSPESYGFDLGDEWNAMDEAGNAVKYDLLGDAWRMEIDARQAKNNP